MGKSYAFFVFNFVFCGHANIILIGVQGCKITGYTFILHPNSHPQTHSSDRKIAAGYRLWEVVCERLLIILSF